MAVQLRRSDPFSSLNLTPLIDVVFFLVVFFLVAAGAEQGERQMDVVLPSAAQTRPMVSQVRELVINIDQQGNLFLGSQKVAALELRDALQGAAGNDPGQLPVLIRADRRCNWETVIHVMDACHAVGIRDIYPMTSGEMTGGEMPVSES